MTARFLIFVPAWMAERYIARALESALGQDYPRSLFRVVCVVDASPDGTVTEAWRVLERPGRHLHAVKIAPPPEEWPKLPTLGQLALRHPLADVAGSYYRDVLLVNPEHVGVVGNTWNVCHHFAEPDEVVVQLDADDRLAHDRVLRVLAAQYDGTPSTAAWLTYGSYASDEESRNPDPSVDPRGIAQPVPPGEHTRRAGWRSTHLRSWKAWLFRKVPRAELEHLGAWVDAAADHATMWPMLELAGPVRARYLHEILYLKNDANPLCEHKYKQASARAMAAHLIARAPYLPLRSPADAPRREGEP